MLEIKRDGYRAIASRVSTSTCFRADANLSTDSTRPLAMTFPTGAHLEVDVHGQCLKVPRLDASALAGNDSILAVIQPPQELTCWIKDPVEQKDQKEQSG